jgi:hypothetical protein
LMRHALRLDRTHWRSLGEDLYLSGHVVRSPP